MTSNTTAEVADRKDERKRKRGAVVKFSLAGAALLGIAAAATSASWSDDAWFKIGASAATVELEASVDGGTTWVPADLESGAAEITLDTSAFGNLNQGADEDVTVLLRNAGSVDLDVTQADLNGATAGKAKLVGTIFAGLTPAEVAVSFTDTTLAAYDEATDTYAETSAVVSLTTSGTWPDTYQGTTGTITLQFVGQS